jgi:hypothetical protein
MAIIYNLKHIDIHGFFSFAQNDIVIVRYCHTDPALTLKKYPVFLNNFDNKFQFFMQNS